jgi:hypothetical protein
MVYRLKKGPEFEEVDGTHAGMRYRKGAVYKEKDIPPDKRDRFETVNYETVKEKPKAENKAEVKEKDEPTPSPIASSPSPKKDEGGKGK